MRATLPVAERIEPDAEARPAALGDRARRERPQQAAGALGVVAGDGVLQRLVRFAVPVVPVDGAAVQLGLEVGLDPGELGAQRGREQRMVVERRVAPIEWLERHAAIAERREHGGRSARLEHGVAQRSGQPRQDRAAAQERALPLGQLVEQLGPEVVGDEAVGAGEVGDRAVGIRLFGDRQPGEIQRRGPARGPLDQAVELSAVELQPGRREQPRGFQSGHRELARRDLVDEMVRAQPPDRRGRSDARREREHGALGQSLGGLDELAERRLVGELRVVDDDHARRGLVDQLRRLADAVLGGVRLQRDPGERPAVAGRPLGEERRLAVARGRHDQHDRRVAAGDQAPDESRTRHHPAPERRRAELRAAAIRQVQREDGCFSGHA